MKDEAVDVDVDADDRGKSCSLREYFVVYIHDTFHIFCKMS